jgi:hypothetical protein
MLLKYVLAWVPMVLIAIGNAAIREASYRRFMGELRAHQLSTLIAIILFGVYIWALTRVWPIQSSAQALTIGLIWLGLTVVFEFVFGHYVMANSWERLFHDYNLSAWRGGRFCGLRLRRMYSTTCHSRNLGEVSPVRTLEIYQVALLKNRRS